jgi:phosphoribosyl-dephospho-CoA transferase
MIKRHDLLDITDKGRGWASRNLMAVSCVNEDLPNALKLITEEYNGVKVPGVVRREERQGNQGVIPIGFSSPYQVDGRRIRVATFALPEEVTGKHTPYQVLEAEFSSRTPCLRALAELKKVAVDIGVKLGAWGSAGLEIYTGLPYTHAASDLDLLIDVAELNYISIFAEHALAKGQGYGFRVDMELDLPSGYGISVLELLKGSDLILGKSLNGVELIHRSSVMDFITG